MATARTPGSSPTRRGPKTDLQQERDLRAAWLALERAQDDLFGLALKSKEIADEAAKAQDRAAKASNAIAKLLEGTDW